MSHLPQTGMVGAYGEQLLDWLNTYTFPCESQFADRAHAEEVADIFIKELLRNGTTTALVFGSVHPQSVEAFFEAAEKLDLRMIAGKVMMDHNAPDDLTDTAESGYLESKALIERWHGKGRLHYAVTPRFAPTSTPESNEPWPANRWANTRTCTCRPTIMSSMKIARPVSPRSAVLRGCPWPPAPRSSRECQWPIEVDHPLRGVRGLFLASRPGSPTAGRVATGVAESRQPRATSTGGPHGHQVARR